MNYFKVDRQSQFVQGYRLFYRPSGGNWLLQDINSPSERSTVLSNLLRGTEYELKIRPYFDEFQGKDSRTLLVRMPEEGKNLSCFYLQPSLTALQLYNSLPSMEKCIFTESGSLETSLPQDDCHIGFFSDQSSQGQTVLLSFERKELPDQEIWFGVGDFHFILHALASIAFFFSITALKHQNMRIMAIVGHLRYEN